MSSTCAEREEVELRTIDVDDIDHVTALFDRMSPQSKYLRFLSPSSKVSSATIRHLASVDHDRHEALGVFEDGELVGSAHYFRSLDDPTRAEISVEVDDAFHRLGLGTCLLRELAQLARRSGITHFTATVLAENSAVLALLDHAGWPRASRYDGPELILTMELHLPRR